MWGCPCRRYAPTKCNAAGAELRAATVLVKLLSVHTGMHPKLIDHVNCKLRAQVSWMAVQQFAELRSTCSLMGLVLLILVAVERIR